MRVKNSVIKFASLALAIAGMAGNGAMAAEIPRISKETLKEMLGSPQLVILDVRTERHWQDSESKIQGAVREDPRRIDEWTRKYTPDKTIVLY